MHPHRQPLFATGSAADCFDVVVHASTGLVIDELHRQLHPAGAGLVRLDLSGMTFIDPAGLVGLAVAAERASAARRPIDFRRPRNADVATYLSRMRLDEHVDALGVPHDLPMVRERRQGHRLVELSRFEGEAGLDQVAEALVHPYVREGSELTQPLHAALREITGNVIEHSGRHYGYVALQKYDRRNDIAFSVADSGIGLRRSLEAVVRVPDDRIAIVRAAERHISATEEPGRGRGIGTVIRITGARRGFVSLVSGRAHGTFRNGSSSPQLADLRTSFAGTLAHVRLSL